MARTTTACWPRSSPETLTGNCLRLPILPSVLSDSSHSYRHGCAITEVSLASLGPLYSDPVQQTGVGLRARSYLCPSCGLALDAEVVGRAIRSWAASPWPPEPARRGACQAARTERFPFGVASSFRAGRRGVPPSISRPPTSLPGAPDPEVTEHPRRGSPTRPPIRPPSRSQHPERRTRREGLQVVSVVAALTSSLRAELLDGRIDSGADIFETEVASRFRCPGRRHGRRSARW